jgi:hypothetical protein
MEGEKFSGKFTPQEQGDILKDTNSIKKRN